MKTVGLCLVLILAVTSVCHATEKDPAIQRRKEFCHELFQLLEQRTGYWAYVRIAPGKRQDVLQLYPNMRYGKLGLLDDGADMPVDSFVSFKEDIVDKLLEEPYRSRLKALGFTAIQLKTSTHSESFPKGIWNVPLD